MQFYSYSPFQPLAHVIFVYPASDPLLCGEVRLLLVYGVLRIPLPFHVVSLLSWQSERTDITIDVSPYLLSVCGEFVSDSTLWDFLMARMKAVLVWRTKENSATVVSNEIGEDIQNFMIQDL